MKEIISKTKKPRAKFKWSQIPEPFSSIIKFIARYWLLLLIGFVLVIQKFRLKMNLKEFSTIYILLFISVFGWAFTKQKNRIFQIFGYVLIVSGVYVFLIEFLLK